MRPLLDGQNMRVEGKVDGDLAAALGTLRIDPRVSVYDFRDLWSHSGDTSRDLGDGAGGGSLGQAKLPDDPHTHSFTLPAAASAGRALASAA